MTKSLIQAPILNYKDKMTMIEVFCFQVQSCLKIVLVIQIKNKVSMNKIQNIKKIFGYIITNKVFFRECIFRTSKSNLLTQK